jgi:hypothetical protein
VVNPSRRNASKSRAGVITLELFVAIGLLSAALLPLAFSFNREQKVVRGYYFRALAMEIVDGEAEILAAGEWHHFPQGTHPYPVKAEAATNLPPGQFRLTVESAHLRLEWIPDRRGMGGPVMREVSLQPRTGVSEKVP